MQHYLQNCGKNLANRLEHILPSIISHNQVAFMKERSTIDDAMIGIDMPYHIYI